MNKQFISWILSGCALGLVVFPVWAGDVPATDRDADSATDVQVAFFCGQTFDSSSKSQIPTTLVWVPEKQGNVALIRWKSQYFERSTWSNKKRCEAASAKFQQLWSAGQLNLVTTGNAKNGLPIVCGVANEGDPCNDRNQIFTLKPFADPNLVTSQLANIFQGKASSPVYESGGDGSQLYIRVRDLLKKGVVVSSPKPAPPQSL